MFGWLFRRPKFKYWVGITYGNWIYVERGRTNPTGYCPRQMMTLLDGPFDSQEDAVHSLHFWKHQYASDHNQALR